MIIHESMGRLWVLLTWVVLPDLGGTCSCICAQLEIRLVYYGNTGMTGISLHIVTHHSADCPEFIHILVTELQEYTRVMNPNVKALFKPLLTSCLLYFIG